MRCEASVIWQSIWIAGDYVGMLTVGTAALRQVLPFNLVRHYPEAAID
jgi:hypothetical protein